MRKEVPPIEEEVVVERLKALDELTLIQDHFCQTSSVPLIRSLNLLHKFVLVVLP